MLERTSIKLQARRELLTQVFHCVCPPPQFLLVPWKMRVITVYDDEREEIMTYVSTYDLQGQSIKAS